LAWTSVALAALIVMPAVALEPTQRTEEVCAEVEAYSFRMKKAERKQREEEARHEAFSAMAEKIWIDAFDDSPRSSYGDAGERLPVSDTYLPVSRSAFATLRSRYRVNERLAGGRYQSTGDKNGKLVAYCLPPKLYERAREELRADRARVLDSLRLRFAAVEWLIGDGDLETASAELASLRIEVVAEDLELATYHSGTEDRTEALRVWLTEWSEEAPRGPGLVRDLNARAEELIAQGNLVEADRYLTEALEIDWTDDEARSLRARIQEKRNAQTELLLEAEELANEGRFRAAGWKLGEARALDTGDEELIDDTEKTIDGLRAADRTYNPPMKASLFTTMGSLGVDTAAIEERVFEDTGLSVDSSRPLSVGASGSFRVGRQFLVGVSLSWGFSQAKNFSYGGEALTFFDLLQATAGVGYATRRSATRHWSFQASGGLVWERVDVDGLFKNTLDDASAQSAFYARFAAERKNLSLFIQHGIGFDEEVGSLISWSNSFQLGVGVVF
jgi:hypothetical protein